MTEELKFDPEAIEITNFKIIKGEILASFDFNEELIHYYETNMFFNASYSTEEEIVKVDIGFEIQTVSDEDQKEVTSEFHFVFIFEVPNLEEFLSFEKGKIVHVNYGLLNSVASVAYSTSRGILMSRFQGTAMREYVLPIISLKNLLNMDS